LLSWEGQASLGAFETFKKNKKKKQDEGMKMWVAVLGMFAALMCFAFLGLGLTDPLATSVTIVFAMVLIAA
jgi:fatty acid desaturase